MRNKEDFYKNFCTGCGLCESYSYAKLEINKNGFNSPINCKNGYEEFCDKICPASGVATYKYNGTIFGETRSSYYSWSTNEDTRFKASSGGVLTELCIFLLDTKKCDGIIQTIESDENPIETKTICSTTKKEILNCCGSRYSSSSPLKNIKQYLDKGKRYAFVGKPCDVTALQNLCDLDDNVANSFPYIFSFYCAGAPSKNANQKLLEKLNSSESECKSLKYRGDGWPGYATAINKNGEVNKITYREAWRDTLGRDIRPICRLCLDGIGESADIACCDAWYIENNQPVFNENAGRNAVFCRTQKGESLFLEACSKGYLEKYIYDTYDKDLRIYQSYQYSRKATMKISLLAFKLKGICIPKYSKKVLNSYAKYVGPKTKLKKFIGIIKRINDNQIKLERK